MNLDKKDVQSIADGRIYGAKGLALAYRIVNGICTLSCIATAIYFLLIEKGSPVKGLNNPVPESIQHPADWFYLVALGVIGISFLVNTFLYHLLEARVKFFVESWNKTGKIPERKQAVTNGEKT